MDAKAYGAIFQETEMNFISTWINARKEIKLKEMEYAERRRIKQEEFEENEVKWALVNRQSESWKNENKISGMVNYEGKVVYSFYENANGKRRVELDTNEDRFLKDKEQFKKSSLYWKLVCIPWIDGQYVKDIDTYEQAMQGRLIDELKNGIVT